MANPSAKPAQSSSVDSPVAVPRFAVVVLAAGGSVERGLPTQLHPYLGRTLVEHAARTAIASGACEVVVVVGDHADKVRPKLARLPVRVVENRHWKEGIGSSIRTGVSALKSNPASVVVSLCDQPKVTPDHLKDLVGRVLGGDGIQIAASSYDGISGAPAAFAESVFPNLMKLEGPFGARNLIRNAGSLLEAIQFAEANAEVEIEPLVEDPLPCFSEAIPPKPHNRSRPARAPPRRQLPALSRLARVLPSPRPLR